MRCCCCDRNLSDWESTAKNVMTGEYLDMCTTCLKDTGIQVEGRKELSDQDDHERKQRATEDVGGVERQPGREHRGLAQQQGAAHGVQFPGQGVEAGFEAGGALEAFGEEVGQLARTASCAGAAAVPAPLAGGVGGAFGST